MPTFHGMVHRGHTHPISHGDQCGTTYKNSLVRLYFGVYLTHRLHLGVIATTQTFLFNGFKFYLFERLVGGAHFSTLGPL